MYRGGFIPGMGPPISTITGQPIPTAEEKIQAGRTFLDPILDVSPLVAEFLPGVGEYIDFGETLEYGKQAEKALFEGRVLDALSAYSNAFVSSMGTVPLK